MALYVYSVTAGTHPHRLDGLTGVGESPSPPRTVTAGPLAAVVSDVTEEIRPKRRDLAAHQEVQERLMADGTVLPLQFGYTAPDDLAVRQALEDAADDYLAALGRLTGCAEYHLRASQEEEPLLRRILKESEEARGLNDRIRSGVADPRLPVALGELVAREVEQRQDALAASLVEALLPFAREHAVHPHSAPDFLNLSLLVSDGSKDDFLTAQADLADRTDDGVELRLTGPLPPYSFVQ
ncbi:GvpL/GvpF family gas vesicle protein [Streptomyces kanasensis]|uniref:GvpL/GvpF family gas vesicle protein n=1 Tax=Streptomyces kanasensis TaxID=936756 RepID=UPI003702F690